VSNTSAPLNENMSSQAQIPSDVKESSVPEPSYTVGYGRPPTHARFKPGQSGNPKGRPKRNRSLYEQRQQLYMRDVPVTIGNRKQMMPLILAIEHALMEKALTGDPRAVQAAIKVVKELDYLKHNGIMISYMKMTEDDLNAA
jgi:hypothetical protein